MKKMHQMSAAALAALMAVGTLAGCGSSGPANDGTAAQNAQQMSTATEDTALAGTGDAAGDGTDLPTLHVWGFGYTATTEDCEKVSEAVSRITREKIGANVQISRSSDSEKLNLALTSGEPLDLVNYHAYSGGLTALVAAGMAAPIDDLLAQYGQDAVKAVGEDMLVCGKINGVQYSIPNLKEFSCGYGIAMRKDVLDELGINVDDVKTMDDIHDVLKQVREKKPDLYPLVPSWAGGGMQKTIPYDNLGTGFLDAYGVLADVFDDSTTVVNLYETDAYRDYCKRMYQWNQEGLIMPDATTTTESNLCQTVGFADWENYVPGKADVLTRDWGHEAVMVQLIPSFMSSDAGGDSFFIPEESENKEKAMQLWDLLYTDADLENLLVYGIEGRDYTLSGDGKVVTKVDGSTYDWVSWSWPNPRIAYITSNDDPDIVDKNVKFDEEARKSPAFGFKFDSTMVQNELTACGNVINKYDAGLRWGVMNPDEALPKFNEELKAAGIDTIIQEKQKQLDAFLAAK